jgi:hypothetical protein
VAISNLFRQKIKDLANPLPSAANYSAGQLAFSRNNVQVFHLTQLSDTPLWRLANLTKMQGK